MDQTVKQFINKSYVLVTTYSYLILSILVRKMFTNKICYAYYESYLRLLYTPNTVSVSNTFLSSSVIHKTNLKEKFGKYSK